MPFCIKCGFSLTEKSKFCGKCGNPVGIPAKLVCLNCNTPIKNTDKFCAKCGTPLKGVPSLICKTCNSKLKSSDKFCFKCGTPVVTSSSSFADQKPAETGMADAVDQSALNKRKKEDEAYESSKEAAIRAYNSQLTDNQDLGPEQMLNNWVIIGKQLYDVYLLSQQYPEREEDTSAFEGYLNEAKSRADKYTYIINLNKYDEESRRLQSDFKAKVDHVQQHDTDDELALLSEFKELYTRVSALVDEYYDLELEEDADGASLAELQKDIAYCYCCLLYAMNRYEPDEGEGLSKQQKYDFNVECSEISGAFDQPRFSALKGLSSYKLYQSCVEKEKQDPDESGAESVTLIKDKETALSDAKTALKAMNNSDYCYKVSAFSESGLYFDTAEWENTANSLIRLFALLIKEGEYQEACDLSWMAIESHVAAAARKENGNAKRFVDSFIEKHDRFTKDEDGDLIYKK